MHKVEIAAAFGGVAAVCCLLSLAYHRSPLHSNQQRRPFRSTGAPEARRWQLGNGKQPPPWNPENAANYSFDQWSRDLLLWSHTVSELAPSTQAALVIASLEGSAKLIGEEISSQQIAHGDTIACQLFDPLTLVLHNLATHYAPLAEETRLMRENEFDDLRRDSNEPIDAFLARFNLVRRRAGARHNHSQLTSKLLREISLSHQQLSCILQPTNQTYPNDESEFTHMCILIRRICHITERTPNNIAQQLASRRRGQQFQGLVDTADAPDEDMECAELEPAGSNHQ